MGNEGGKRRGPARGWASSDPDSGFGPYLVPAAIVIGLGLVGLGAYLGLSRRPVAAPRSGEARRFSPFRAGPRGVLTPCVSHRRPRGRAEVDELPPPPGRAHTRAAFLTRWYPQMPWAAEACAPLSYLEKGPRIWYLEIPYELKIEAEGAVVSARPAGSPRAVLDTGEHRPAQTSQGCQPLLECYSAQIKRRVQFPPATSGSSLRVWVRVYTVFEGRLE